MFYGALKTRKCSCMLISYLIQVFSRCESLAGKLRSSKKTYGQRYKLIGGDELGFLFESSSPKLSMLLNILCLPPKS